MKREVIISARQTGKTTWLIDQFQNDVETQCPIFVVHNSHRVSDISRQMKQPFKGKILSIESLLPFICLDARKHYLYLDEFLFFTKEQKKKLFYEIQNRGIEFTAISTANKLYSEDKLSDCKFWWEHHHKHPDIFLTEEAMISKYGEDYLYNLTLLPNISFYCRANEYKKLLSPTQYTTEILGLFSTTN